MKKEVLQKPKRRFRKKILFDQRYLLLMSVPFVIWAFVFCYVPLWGWIMAFQNVRPASLGTPFWQREFVGFGNFIKVFSDRLFVQTFLNTVAMSFIGIAVSTLVAVFLAVMLNELVFSRFKKFTQTVSYLPHFVSWVIVSSIAKAFLNDGGVMDSIFGTNLHLMTSNSPVFWWVCVLVDVWKEMGWSAIIYLSAITGIDKGLYEAARVDGANRLQQIRHITLPGIRSTVIVLLIMSVGSVLNVGMERQMLLSNGLVQDHAMVLSWLSYERGIGNNNYGVGTAIGMFQSVVGILLLLAANKIAGKFGEEKLI